MLIRDALNFAKEEISQLDAQVLLSFMLGLSKLDLFLNSQKKIKSKQFEEYEKLINRRKNHEPVAYLTGHKEFFGLDFKVNQHTLIPRPDTEILVEEILEKIKNNNKNLKINYLDICTGTGCVVISVAKSLEKNKNIKFYASDISEEALKVAEENAKNLGVEVEFSQSDLFEIYLNNKKFENYFDIISANPPYISEAEFKTLEPDVTDFEPKSALTAKKDGLLFYERILKDAKNLLKPAGYLICEIGANQQAGIEGLDYSGYSKPEFIDDLAKNCRVVIFQRN